MKKIIIDTDPGIDDALAICLACFSDTKILGLTTVFGNSTIDNTTRNALTILEILNKNIIVFRGASKPLFGKKIKAISQGNNGLGGFRKKIRSKISNASAIEFIIKKLEMFRNNEITFLCMGPTTNLAIVSILRPDLVGKIKEIIILGGVFREKGNISNRAEFNVFNDPLALQTVLEIDCKKTLIPINICRKMIFTKEDFNEIRNISLNKFFKKISDLYIDYYIKNDTYGGFKGGIMYDLLTILYLNKPEYFKAKNVNIGVNLKESNFGLTYLRKNIGENNCKVIAKINAEKAKNYFFDTINKL